MRITLVECAFKKAATLSIGARRCSIVGVCRAVVGFECRFDGRFACVNSLTDLDRRWQLRIVGLRQGFAFSAHIITIIFISSGGSLSLSAFRHGHSFLLSKHLDSLQNFQLVTKRHRKSV